MTVALEHLGQQDLLLLLDEPTSDKRFGLEFRFQYGADRLVARSITAALCIRSAVNVQAALADGDAG